MFIGRTDAEAEIPILQPPDVNGRLTGKDPGAGKDWRQEEKGMTEDEMVGWHHGLNGHKLGQTAGVSEGQRGLVCCSPWGCKELGMIWRLDNNNNNNKINVGTRLPDFGILRILTPVPVHTCDTPCPHAQGVGRIGCTQSCVG